jgi:hypothetical protein
MSAPVESFTVAEQDVDAFQRDGVVVLRAVLSDDEVGTLARGVERNPVVWTAPAGRRP